MLKSKLSNDVIINLSREGSRRMDMQLKLSFASDLKKIKETIFSTLKNFPGVIHQPEAKIGVAEILPDGYKIELNIWLDANKYYENNAALQEKLIENIMKSEAKLLGM